MLVEFEKMSTAKILQDDSPFIKITRGQFNKENTKLLNWEIHKFKFSESLYKFLLQASNLYVQWFLVEFNFYNGALCNCKTICL